MNNLLLGSCYIMLVSLSWGTDSATASALNRDREWNELNQRAELALATALKFRTESRSRAPSEVINEVDKAFLAAADLFSQARQQADDHRTAGVASFNEAKCLMMARRWDQALDLFTSTILPPELSEELLAEAMYWRLHTILAVIQDESTKPAGNRRADLYDLSGQALTIPDDLQRRYPGTVWARYAKARIPGPDPKLSSNPSDSPSREP